MRHLATLANASAAALLIAACTPAPKSQPVSAYAVDEQRSSIHFITVKAGQPGAAGVSEVSRFERFSGGISAAGRIELNVDLSSVSTGVGIRDDRLRTMLFNVAAYPKASFTASIDPGTLSTVADKGSVDVPVDGQFSLGGQTKPMNAKLRVTRLDTGSIQASTLAPIVVDASQYGLKPGVDALREVMGLNFLAAASPVNFTMVLHAQR